MRSQQQQQRQRLPMLLRVVLLLLTTMSVVVFGSESSLLMTKDLVDHNIVAEDGEVAVAITTTTTTMTTVRNDNNHHRQLSSSVYAIYNLDAFAVTFDTVNTDELQVAYRDALGNGTTTGASSSSSSSTPPPRTLVSETGKVQSSLSYPLRSITQDFLFDGFQALIDVWEEQGGESVFTVTTGSMGDTDDEEDDTGSSAVPYIPEGGESTGEDGGGGGVQVGEVDVVSSPPPSSSSTKELPPFNSIYNFLVTVELHVRLYVRNDLDDDDDNDASDGTNVRLRRQLQNNSSSSSTTTTTERAYMLAEIFPTIAFLEPTNKDTKPTNQEVATVFGLFMDELFTNHRDVYLRELVQSSQDLLQEITRLDVTLNIFKKEEGSASAGSSSSSTNGWSNGTQIALLTTLIVVSVSGVAWMLLYWKQRRHRRYKRRTEQLRAASLDGNHDDEYHDEWDETSGRRQFVRKPSLGRNASDASGGNQSHGDHSFISSISSGSFLSRPSPLGGRSTSLDSVRHGQDVYHNSSTASAMSALEASDRYLSRHRPDLYHDQQHQQFVGGDNNHLSVFGRNYQIPSNPFDYIYKGFFQQQQQQQPMSASSQTRGDFLSPTSYPTTSPYGNGGPDGPVSNNSNNNNNGSFPFTFSPRGAFSPSGSSSSVGGSTNTGGGFGRRTSFTVPSPHHSFTPIGQLSSRNLMAGAEGEVDDGDHPDVNGGIGPAFGSPPTQGAHTGQTWQDGNNGTNSSNNNYHDSDYGNGTGGVVASIWRNLSVSSWYQNGSNHSDSPRDGVEGGEIQFGHHDDPSLDPDMSNGDIELEELQDDGDYDFPFMDFPRHDGTPCLIYNEDVTLQERQRRAADVFAVDTGTTPNNNGTGEDNDDLAEKKSDDRPNRRQLSNEMFQRMLSQNSLAIDDASYDEDDQDGDMGDAGGSPSLIPKAFQRDLSQLLETKQRRYAMEFKKNDIMEEHRKKRKQAREQERRERHKAMEREIEDIEAEYFTDKPSRVVLQQPLSPLRSSKGGGSGNASHSPKASKYVRSPARISGGLHHSTAVPASPYRSRGGRGTDDMFRSRPPSSTSSGNCGIAKSASMESPHLRHSTTSPPGGQQDSQEFKLRVRPVKLYGSEVYGSNIQQEDMGSLSLPTIGVRLADGNTDAAADDDEMYPSPQSVMDEVMQHSPSKSQQHTQRHILPNHPSSTLPHRRTGSSSKFSPSSLLSSNHRRINSFDVEDSIIRSRIASTTTTVGRQQPPSPRPHRRQDSNGGSMTPSKGGGGGYRRGSSLTPSHRRTSSQQSPAIGNNRSSSHQSDDIFLHGVVAQTRFV